MPEGLPKGSNSNLFIRDQNLTIVRPSDLTTNRSNTFRHIHGAERRRDYQPRARKVTHTKFKDIILQGRIYRKRGNATSREGSLRSHTKLEENMPSHCYMISK